MCLENTSSAICRRESRKPRLQEFLFRNSSIRAFSWRRAPGCAVSCEPNSRIVDRALRLTKRFPRFFSYSPIIQSKTERHRCDRCTGDFHLEEHFVRNISRRDQLEKYAREGDRKSDPTRKPDPEFSSGTENG